MADYNSPGDGGRFLPARQRYAGAAGAFALVAAFVAGCGTTPAEPFQAFTQSLVELKGGTDEALTLLAPRAESRFKRELVADLEGDVGTDRLDTLQITTADGSPFAISATPLFLKLDQFKIGASLTTAALVDYANLLQQLADPELLPQATFDQLSEDLNAHAFQALSAMQTEPSEQAENNVALLSDVAIRIVQAYLESKRREELLAALEGNQESVVTYAGRMQSAVEIIAGAFTNEYVNESADFMRQALEASTRQRGIEGLIALDRAYIREISTLQELHAAYGRIPAAHAQLAAVVAEPDQGISAIVSVLQAGQRLQANYSQASLANRIANAEATAEAAVARAEAREAQADTAALRAAAANVAAVDARLAANAAPDDELKDAVATEAEDMARDLGGVAARLAAEATALREAAIAVQEQADQIKANSGRTSP